jgi:hypothetical protein
MPTADAVFRVENYMARGKHVCIDTQETSSGAALYMMN